jgi:hypoxanthine phosphoribosyltransferase
MPAMNGFYRTEVLISAEQIRARIAEMGRDIGRQHTGRRLICIGVLKGSFMFLADLVRAIPLPELEVDFIGVSSYQGTESTGVVRITHDLARSIEGEDVLLVEDIVDTGLTVRYLLDNLATRRPRTLKVAALLEKPSRSRVQVPIEFKGFTIEDRFVVGYGLDFDGRLRNLPHVALLHMERPDGVRSA